MNPMVEILQQITRTAYKSHETLKSIEQYTEVPETTNACQIYTLLEKIQINSIKSVLEIVSQTSENEIIESLQTILECMEACESIYINAIPYKTPEELKYMLNANMESLKGLRIKFAPLVR